MTPPTPKPLTPKQKNKQDKILGRPGKPITLDNLEEIEHPDFWAKFSRHRPITPISTIVDAWIYVFRRVQAKQLLDRLDRAGVTIQVKDNQFVVNKTISPEDVENLKLLRPECLSLLHGDPVKLRPGERTWESKSPKPSMTNTCGKDSSTQTKSMG